MDEDLLEALASLPTFHHATVSPDGSEVAVYYDETGRNELHVVDVETGERTRWSDGEVPRNARWHVEWGADGERVFFHLDDDGNEQNDVYAIDRDGSAEPVVELDGQTILQDIGEDGETLLVGSTASGQMQLYRHDCATGATTQLTAYDRAVGAGVLSPDCERIAYATNETDTFENTDTYVADADGSNPRNLEIGETGAEVAPVDWSPDGDRLLVTDNTADLGRCGVYDLSTDEVTWYGGEFDEDADSFLPGGDRFLAVRIRECAKEVVVYDARTGAATTLDLPTGVASLGRAGSAVVDEERIVCSHTTPDRRPELLCYDLATDETEQLIAADYGDLDPDRFVDAEYFTFDSAGVAEFDDRPGQGVESDPASREIEALLYDSGERPSPAIVNPHGGPRGQDTRGFDLYTQFLCSQGYSVLKVNYRGSTGRGREFAQAIYDDWGGNEQADIAKGTTILAEKEWVDDDRIAVFGGSYGGYSAYCQLTMYPELYDAGVAWIGVTDLRDLYENTMPHYRTELLEKNVGSPEENPELYDERSPITHAENLAAPLLVLHGVNDRRVPVSQARLFRDRLDELGYEAGEDGDYEYVELGEEGHASTDVDQKIRTFRMLADFLERRL
ncbi:prolyl oligopeptidase family serine peptidase [Halomicrobium sp. LC1Hm]|uniref:S9 family peptidase n=1 Tax=Halomicrobium sp. LC1Hm TaxID=2610902 RepID=UPI00129838EB|nr:prolyl oligopeptidase family serine peptidase [Halomicrobium sp. LC1Hm]